MDFLVALGSNLPDPAGSPADNLRRALVDLASGPLRLRAISRFYRTPCFPPGAGPDFVNAAAMVSADLTADQMLERLHGIEAAFGRQRSARWGARPLDLDLIAAGDAVLPDLAQFSAWRDLPVEDQATQAPDQLILPHPRLADRAFVLVPLTDIAPGWVHPVSGRTLVQMRDMLGRDDLDAVRAI